MLASIFCLICFRRQHCDVPSSCFLIKSCIVYIWMCVKGNKIKLSELTFLLTKISKLQVGIRAGSVRRRPSSPAAIEAPTRRHAPLQSRVFSGTWSPRAAVSSSKACPSCPSSFVGLSWVCSKCWFFVSASSCVSLCLVLPFSVRVFVIDQKWLLLDLPSPFLEPQLSRLQN